MVKRVSTFAPLHACSVETHVDDMQELSWFQVLFEHLKVNRKRETQKMKYNTVKTLKDYLKLFFNKKQKGQKIELANRK